MFFCPQCGTDRRNVAPVAPCPSCGMILADVLPTTPSKLNPAKGASTPRQNAKSAGIEREYKPSATGIVLGVLFMMAGLGWWMMSTNASFTPLGRAIFAVIMGLGVLGFITGIFNAPVARGNCSACQKNVLLKRTSLSWKCVHCKRYVAIAPLGVVSLIGATIIVVYVVLAVLAVSSETERKNGATRFTLATRVETITDKQAVVKEDQYYTFSFTLNKSAELSVAIDSISGPEYEVWTMEESDFRRWEKAAGSLFGGEFRYFKDLSASGIHKLHRTARLPAGSYYVVVDNSNAGRVSPPTNFSNDRLTVHVKLTARH